MTSPEDRLVEHLLRREVVLFVSARASTEAQPPLPVWKDLIGGLAAEIPGLSPSNVEKYDVLNVAQSFICNGWSCEEHTVAGCTGCEEQCGNSSSRHHPNSA